MNVKVRYRYQSKGATAWHDVQEEALSVSEDEMPLHDRMILALIHAHPDYCTIADLREMN